MNKPLVLLISALLCITHSCVQPSQTDHTTHVAFFINCIKTSDTAKLSTMVAFPFARPAPIPSIKNQAEFKARYAEMFDDSLRQVIIASKFSKDWKIMGSKGIMLHNGLVWLDFNGRLLSVNHTSKIERQVARNLTAADQDTLYKSLKRFEKPIFTIETPKFMVRIDLLEKETYRYASWSKDKTQTEKPDLVLENGERIQDGSGGNHHYSFVNGAYTYTVFVNRIGTDETSPFNLVVTQDQKELLNHAAALKN